MEELTTILEDPENIPSNFFRRIKAVDIQLLVYRIFVAENKETIRRRVRWNYFCSTVLGQIFRNIPTILERDAINRPYVARILFSQPLSPRVAME